MKVVCIKDCFYNSKLYKVGEGLELEGKKPKVPAHFEPEAKAKKKLKPEAKEVAEPKTYKELQEKQKREVTLE